jgi:hypothetical protein
MNAFIPTRGIAILVYGLILYLLELVGPVHCAPLAAASGLRSQPPQLEVRWKGKAYALEELPTEVDEASRIAVEAWAGWAAERDYRLHLADDQRALLILDQRARPARPMKLAAQTVELFDALLPAPERLEPEDTAPPDDAPADGEPGADGEAWSYSYSYSDGAPLDTETPVLLQVRDVKDYYACLDHAAELEPYLASWVATGRELTGFVVERPLAAAWIENAPGMQEWDIENELVHRLASLLIVRRFGQVPYWLHMGTSWHIEEQVRRSIYCFPYRRGFVWATEHGGWGDRLAQLWRDEPGTVSMADLAGWKRGSYVEEPALQSWGTARFLAAQPAGVYSRLLEDLRLFREEHGVDRHADGTWSRIPGYEVPASDQRAIFECHLGDAALEQLTRSFRSRGKGSKTRKRSKGARR